MRRFLNLENVRLTVRQRFSLPSLYGSSDPLFQENLKQQIHQNHQNRQITKVADILVRNKRWTTQLVCNLTVHKKCMIRSIYFFYRYVCMHVFNSRLFLVRELKKTSCFFLDQVGTFRKNTNNKRRRALQHLSLSA